MTLLRLSPTALARCRFGVSPLAETVGSLIALHGRCTDPWLAPWHARHHAEYRSWLRRDPVAGGLIPLAATTKWLPDVLALPPPGGMHTRLADELPGVAAYTDEQVRATVADALAASWRPPDTSWLALDGLGSRIAAALDEAWARFVAPDWPRRRALLERDIMHRAGLLAAYGWKQTVEGMTRRSTWVGEDAIRFSDQDYPDRWITDDGLVFVPQTSDRGSWTCERPPHYALVYPARGAASSVTAPGVDPLATLLGAGRARIVRELASPATSSQLAHALEVSLGTVSAHLAVLREAGVITGARAGRSVIYRRTERGDALDELLGGEPR